MWQVSFLDHLHSFDLDINESDQQGKLLNDNPIVARTMQLIKYSWSYKEIVGDMKPRLTHNILGAKKVAWVNIQKTVKLDYQFSSIFTWTVLGIWKY